jgi:hypothetical protein
MVGVSKPFLATNTNEHESIALSRQQSAFSQRTFCTEGIECSGASLDFWRGTHIQQAQ